MKITSVELRPAGSTEVFKLSFRDPSSKNPYQVKGIQGLDADDITSRYYGTGGSGTRYYRPTLLKRQPVFLMGLNPRYAGSENENSYSALRDRLYRAINASRTGIIEIRFLTGATPVAYINGNVIKFKAGLFTEKPEIEMTFNTEYPMLRSLSRTALGPFGGNDITVVDELSTAQHGLRAKIKFTGDHNNLVITGTEPSEGQPADWSLEINYAFKMGDNLTLSNEASGLELYLERSGGVTRLADKVKSGSIWPLIFPGTNRFRCPFYSVTWESVSHYRTYWGI
jgi:hypothetical protein